MPKTRYGLILAVVAVVAGLGVVRFVGGSEATARQREALPSGETAAPAPATLPSPSDTPAPPAAEGPAVSFEGAQSGAVPSDHPLQVRLARGTLTAVTVEDPQGEPLAGDLAPDGVTWLSGEPPAPLTAYTVRVVGVGTDRQPFEQTLNVT